jgi:signal transduction histidine kinase
MTLRTKIIVYFVALHMIMAGVAVFLLLENRLLLFAVELLFAISVFVSYRLVIALFVPIDLISTGAELMNERDFGSRFVEVGQPEIDRLIQIYNGMIDRLREERLAAEEQHQLLEKIVQASPSAIVICDFDGKVAQMNPAASRLVNNDLMRELREIPAGESRLVPYQGARRLKVWRTEFRDRGFSKSFYLIEELTEDLRLSEKAAYEKVIRMMSHEVNNTVGAVRSLLESLLRYARDVRDGDREDFTGAVNIATSRMDALNRFMRDIAALLRPELAERRITLTVEVEHRDVIEADRSQFEQVVLNVLRNAEESIGADGSIIVSLRKGLISITDTGSGIADDARTELFNPFFSTKRDGRGLGLTVVQEILTNHGFAYSLQNRTGSPGAEFRIAWGPNINDAAALAAPASTAGM